MFWIETTIDIETPHGELSGVTAGFCVPADNARAYALGYSNGAAFLDSITLGGHEMTRADLAAWIGEDAVKRIEGALDVAAEAA